MVVLSASRVLDCVDDLINEGKQISVNGIDITVHKVFKYKSRLVIDFDNSRRKNPELEEIPFTHEDTSNTMNSYWDLEKGTYMVSYGQKISIPMDAVGLILPRSTLMAGGTLLASALWDSGYSGYGRGQFMVNNPHGIRLYNGARIGQIILIKTEQTQETGYNGTYQNEQKR